MEMNNRKRISLNSNWKFALHESSGKSNLNIGHNVKPGKYFPAEVPGTIHTDLYKNKIIEDPFYSDSELNLKWISQNDWVYETEFDFSENNSLQQDLVFEGLDTISEIYLNDKKIDCTDNMFLRYRYNVSKILKSGKNILKIIFHSPVKYADEQENKYGKLDVALSSNRVHIRKAQYSFGWDWGPIFTTSGIWKDVYLEERPKIFIEDLTFSTKSLGRNKAAVSVIPFLSDTPKGEYSVIAELSNANQRFLKKFGNIKDKNPEVGLIIKEPQLWWPNGEGEQNLYKLNVKLIDNNGQLIDEVNKSIGIRKIELVEKENNKAVFKIKVNGRIVYCKGANWIPADSFLPRVSDDKYFNLLKAAKEANMNIIRVWGGGIYESDKFYEICDELGLLVWQDFMFACAAYPENEEFIKNVKEEIKQNVLRLQHHASIAIWCGNNENEWIWYQDQKSSYKKMPGYKIYHLVIPAILKAIDSERPYWPSSPFGSDQDPNSFNSGNTHQWSIWSRWIDYEEVKDDKSLFVTEFGFQGPANKNTLENCLPVINRKIHDPIFEFHNKQVEGPERVIKFLSGHLPISNNWDDFIYLAQLNQGFALKTCLEHWRTNRITFGSLIWQLNDCWPVTSWSLIDSELMPKLSYHFVKNIFHPQIVKFEKNKNVSCTVYNQFSKAFKGKLKISFIASSTGKIVNEKSISIKLEAFDSYKVEKMPVLNNGEDQIIYIGTIYDIQGNQVHRNYFLDKKWKHITLPPKQIDLAFVNTDEKEYIKLTSHTFNCFIDFYHPNYKIKERGFILLPGEEVEVEVERKIKSRGNLNKIKCYALNDYLSEE